MIDSCLYRTIYDKISCIQCNPEQIAAVKLRFETEINSKRRLDSIASLGQLLKVLEKRDYLSPENIDPFVNIAHAFDDKSVLSLLDNCRAHIVDIQLQPQRVLPDVPSEPKKKVYRLIAEEIGQNWTDFARALSIKEHYIDELSIMYPRISDRIYDILRYYEDDCAKATWKTNLLEALTQARRNDIRKKAQQIFDTH